MDKLQLLSGAATERHSTKLAGLDLEAELALHQRHTADERTKNSEPALPAITGGRE